MDDPKETGRIEAFSDGVFAVAITLLVLDIKVPSVSHNETDLLQALLALWPQLLGFVTSFLTIGIMWMNHHRLFTYIIRANTNLMLLNLFLLMLIVFIPIPTALLTEYIVLPQQHVAAIIYSSTFFIMAVCFNILWRYATHKNRLLGRNTQRSEIESISRQYLFGPLLYILSIALAVLDVPLSVLLNLLLAIFFALPGGIWHRKTAKNLLQQSDDSDAI